MSACLHLDLLKEEERLSSSPVRLRIMVPTVAGVVALACVLWWSLLGLQAVGQASTKRGLKENVDGLAAAHADYLSLCQQTRESGAMLRQLGFYARSRIRFGATLARVPELVPANIQLTEMRVALPPAPPVDPKQPELGPTNALETATLRFAGRTSGAEAYAAVDALLAALSQPAHSNLIQRAEIPKGAFRQDQGRAGDRSETLLFEISCTCVPRRFE